MRRFVPVVLVTLLIGVAVLSASAEPVAASPAPASSGVTIAGTGRVAPPVTLEPKLFGKWWKKFKKIMERILDFIDGLIDDIRGQPEDGSGGGTGKGMAGLISCPAAPRGARPPAIGPPAIPEAAVA